jgi:flagellar biosynthesis/type III secretory pathway chaperone
MRTATKNDLIGEINGMVSATEYMGLTRFTKEKEAEIIKLNTDYDSLSRYANQLERDILKLKKRNQNSWEVIEQILQFIATKKPKTIKPLFNFNFFN